HYPKWEVLPYDEDDLSLEVTAKTLDVFEAIKRRRGDAKGEPFAIVAPVDALMQRVLPGQRIKDLTVRIKWGERVDLDKLDAALAAAGYEREPIVEARGEFSIRGGIVDVFPLNSENPIRIDLFGDEIESIRTFDVSTQRSLADLGADAELIIAPSHLKQQVMAFLKEGGSNGSKLETLFDHLPADTLVVLESPERFAEVCEYFQNAVERQYEIAKKTLEFIAAPDALILRPEAVPAAIAKFRRIEYSANPPAAARGSVHVRFEQTNYAGDTSELDSWIAQIRKFQQKDYLVAVVCDNDGQVQRFEELLRDKEIGAVAVYASGWSEGFELKNVLHGVQDVLLLVGGVQTGFALPDARLCLMTDREIFGRYKRRFVYKKIYKGKPIHSSNEIRRGDYVVHVDHGIGKFQGMRAQELDGRMVDLIEIEYANNDKLLVPVEKINKVQKYSAHEGLEPNLDRLGSSKWAKRREKHSEEIERLAEELLQLYANRQIAQRPPHGEDTRLQLEFESSFLYQETPDQMQAIVDAKKDMEKARPMDRLVCGDVGYGKTEVAIRAIFKCVQSGRQAAVLCPTTILAQQHFNNFRERFADYPVRIEMISRFRKPQ
ncbi:MAG TPA: CarD family transcriptional regulator, partial [Candidatus Sumerlaeota bacterium]|nr:CarD family transcriptional regulator [Candidatus Sumerlaeota bacterium]